MKLFRNEFVMELASAVIGLVFLVASVAFIAIPMAIGCDASTCGAGQYDWHLT